VSLYTALEWHGDAGERVGIVVLGDPESIDEILQCLRELRVVSCAFLTDAGLFSVDARVDWALSGFERGGEG
jgi:hypothetical protein